MFYPWKSNFRNLTARNIFTKTRVLPAKVIMAVYNVFFILAYGTINLIPIQFDEEKK